MTPARSINLYRSEISISSMDSLGWEDSQSYENLFLSNSNSCLFNSKLDLSDDIFNIPIHDIQKARTSLINSTNSDHRSQQDNTQEFYTSSPLMTNNYASINASAGNSLDCLLSGTNSKTDTSAEDDGISVIFSDRRKIWNFGANGVNSSGESSENITSSQSPTTSNHIKSNPTKRTIDQAYHEPNSGGFKLITENINHDYQPKGSKRFRSEQKKAISSSNINFQQGSSNSSVNSSVEEPDPEAIAQMKEMIYRAAAFRPVNLGLEIVEKPKRKNVRISTDPQTVAARQRRERISERIRVLQRLVPGGNKMDTASMLDEAANYLKFLRSQVKALESIGHNKVDQISTTHSINPTASFAFNNHHSFLPMHHFSLQKP